MYVCMYVCMYVVYMYYIYIYIYRRANGILTPKSCSLWTVCPCLLDIWPSSCVEGSAIILSPTSPHISPFPCFYFRSYFPPLNFPQGQVEWDFSCVFSYSWGGGWRRGCYIKEFSSRNYSGRQQVVVAVGEGMGVQILLNRHRRRCLYKVSVPWTIVREADNRIIPGLVVKKHSTKKQKTHLKKLPNSVRAVFI